MNLWVEQSCGCAFVLPGRAIRHKDDYAAILLLDHRYLRASVRSKLPRWISDHLQCMDRFGPAFSAIRQVSGCFKQSWNVGTVDHVHVKDEYLCLYPSNRWGQRHYVFGLSVCLLGMWQSQLKSASVRFGFYVSNPSDSGADLLRAWWVE